MTRRWKGNITALRLELDISEVDWNRIETVLLKPHVETCDGFRVIVNQFAEPRRCDVYRQEVLDVLAVPMKEAKKAQDERFAADVAKKAANEAERIKKGRPNLTDTAATNTRNGAVLTGTAVLKHLLDVQVGKAANEADKKRKRDETATSRAESDFALLTSARGKLEQHGRLTAAEARTVTLAFAKQRGDGELALKRLRKDMRNAEATQSTFASVAAEKGNDPWPWARMLPAATPRPAAPPAQAGSPPSPTPGPLTIVPYCSVRLLTC